jgi:predicted site-specific integrase-resolvase
MKSLTHGTTLLTRKQLAERWQVSVETIKRRERGKLIKPVRLDGRVLRYRLSDIMRFEGEEAL